MSVHVAGYRYTPNVRSVGSLVEVRGFEPLTSAVRRQRSTGLSYTPEVREA